ncbi:hypothetical protein HGRIS_012019 [Hohenbuehelia grisea]|uniref:Uncharacterized protein n=1 Tax=Hohenbuehelia grisea TaxID=104357 RepID=A0ABR3IP48_9AGAR
MFVGYRRCPLCFHSRGTRADQLRWRILLPWEPRLLTLPWAIKRPPFASLNPPNFVLIVVPLLNPPPCRTQPPSSLQPTLASPPAQPRHLPRQTPLPPPPSQNRHASLPADPTSEVEIDSPSTPMEVDRSAVLVVPGPALNSAALVEPRQAGHTFYRCRPMVPPRPSPSYPSLRTCSATPSDSPSREWRVEVKSAVHHRTSPPSFANSFPLSGTEASLPSLWKRSGGPRPQGYPPSCYQSGPGGGQIWTLPPKPLDYIEALRATPGINAAGTDA